MQEQNKIKYRQCVTAYTVKYTTTSYIYYIGIISFIFILLLPIDGARSYIYVQQTIFTVNKIKNQKIKTHETISYDLMLSSGRYKIIFLLFFFMEEGN